MIEIGGLWFYYQGNIKCCFIICNISLQSRFGCSLKLWYKQYGVQNFDFFINTYRYICYTKRDCKTMSMEIQRLLAIQALMNPPWKLLSCKSNPELLVLQIREQCKDLILSDEQLRDMMAKMLVAINKGLGKDSHPSSTVKCWTTFVQDLPNGKGQYCTEVLFKIKYFLFMT